MIRGAWAGLSMLALANLGLGWILGYHSLPSYLAFWLLCACVAVASVRIARRGFGASGFTDTVIRASVIAFALIVLAGLILGVLGLIGTISYLVFFAASALVSGLLKRRESTAVALPRIPVVIAAVLLAALTLVVAVAAIRSPLTLYDSLSYHLLFPARWLLDHRLSIIATPFSDEAQAYAPANGELFLLWLMTPFHGDLLARMGQVPFYILGGVVIYALARRMGARPVHAMYAPAFYFLTKRVVEQAVGADVDLICWGTFLTSLYLGLAAVDSNHRRDWALWGISLGLYIGTKYVSLVCLPVLLVLPIVRWRHSRALWALPGLLVFAAPWYLRNWVIGGSPIYPASLVVAGITIAEGAYTRAAMLNSVLHTTSLKLLPVMLSLAFGATLFFFWMPFGLAGAVRLLLTRPRWPNLFLLLAPVVMAFLCWFGVPDNLDCRFLLPVTMLAWLPLVFAFGANRTWNACVHGLLVVGLAWAAIGWHGEIPIEPLAWPVGNWLAFGGMVGRSYSWLFVGLAAIGIVVISRIGRFAERAILVLVALTCAIGVTLAAKSRPWCPPDGCEFLELSSTYIRDPTLLSWAWLNEHVSGATIAYSGNNLPYPLFGPRLANRVYYVNIDHHANWRFHDYDRAHRRYPATALPEPMLAVSSGMLLPLPGPQQWRVNAARPRYERMEGGADAWMRNLKLRGVTHLYVSSLSAYEIDFMWHNDAGFPIEDEWARRAPENFTLLYENSQVRIFAVHAQ